MKKTITFYQNNEPFKKIELGSNQELSIGRGSENDIVCEAGGVSRNHLLLIDNNNEIYVKDLGSTNGTFVKNSKSSRKRLGSQKLYKIDGNSIVVIAGGMFKIKLSSRSSGTGESNLEKLLNEKKTVKIGRSKTNDITIPSLSVSRKHAVIEKENSRYYITDSSTNGTFINGNKIKGRVQIQSTDRITIGSNQLFISTPSSFVDLAVQANNIEKVYDKKVIGLQKLSISIPKGVFIALMGPSGCGKSTLLKCLNGANPATSGEIKINGLVLNQENFNILKRSIGYVPQDDIVHKELTVQQTLFFAAKLRLSKDVTSEEIKTKITSVLHGLNLSEAEISNRKISELSGGQRKRISIAVELLNDPSILFLDEPTSPLDPETIGEFLKCIQKLVKEGMTVIMVTHKPSDLNYVDEVIFLSKGGYHCFYGDKHNLLSHFQKSDEIEIYSILKNREDGKYWNQKWREKSQVKSSATANPALKRPKTESKISQLFWLCRRYFAIKMSDRFNLGLLIGQPIIIAFLVCFIFENLQGGVLFLIAISAIWFGVNNASKEIVSETPIYLRERMFNLGIGNYILSKITVLSIIAVVQVMLFILIINFYYADSNNDELAYFADPYASLGFMIFLSISATIFGLCLSAIFKSTEKVMTVVPIALIPQIMLAGVISTIDKSSQNILSYFTLGRWGTEGFCHIQDVDNIGINFKNLSPIGDSEFESVEAIKSIGFYKNVDANWSNGLYENLMAILVLNCLFLLILFIALKMKDNKFI